MEIKINLSGIQFSPDFPNKVDFNLAKISFYDVNPVDKGSNFTGNIEIRIPKEYKDMEEIKKYAFGQAKVAFQHCAKTLW